MKAKEAQFAAADKKTLEAKAASEKGKPNLAPLHRQLAMWKAAQFNIKVLDVRKQWKAKQSDNEALIEAARQAAAEAKEEKSRFELLKTEYLKLKPKS